MKVADFLFPRDLEVTPTAIRKVLIVGSCLSEAYVASWRQANPQVTYDHVLFNNAAELPVRTAEEIAQYDLQYIQLPLRSVLTDAAIRINDKTGADEQIDWMELGRRNIDRMLEAALAYQPMLTLVANFVVPQGRIAPSLKDQDSDQDLTAVTRNLNSYLANEISKRPHAYLADVDMIANSFGKRFFLDDIIYFYTHGGVFYPDWAHHERFPPWTSPAPGRLEEVRDLGLTYENNIGKFFDAVHRQMEATYRIVKQVDAVKVVIFDLDNTMWRGQLVEHYGAEAQWPYSHGWPLGIWEAVHHLRRRGIIVTIASKNDESTVVAKWHDAVDPPFVRYDDFLAPQVNWNSKADNIKTLLDNMSLTPMSALLVDDSPVERESVRAMLPGIRVIGSDPFVVRRILLWAPEMQIAARSKESARREDMLKQQFKREHERSAMSRAEFLMTLESKLTITELRSTEDHSFMRAFELVNKTNQFNTTGERWALDRYANHLAQGGRIFAFSVKDRFVDYGTVGVVFALGSQILQFVMSCRVLGMDIELAVIKWIVELLRKEFRQELIQASVRQTESNTPCRDCFTRAGFRQAAVDRFALAGTDAVASPAHVELVDVR